MRRKIPTTAALSVFESAARHRSFTLAATEQAMTQSAVSRQIAGLEAFLGVKLFRRTKRGVVLTEAGLHYGTQVGIRLQEIERDTLELMASRGQGDTLELGVVPTFATKWLLPRLGAGTLRHSRKALAATSAANVASSSRSAAGFRRSQRRHRRTARCPSFRPPRGSPTTSPRSTVRLTSSRTFRPPKRLCSPRTSSSADRKSVV